MFIYEIVSAIRGSPPAASLRVRERRGTMARRSLWAVAGAALLGTVIATASVATAATQAPKAPNPYGDPNLVSIFDGKTLTGWKSSKTGLWTVKNGAIHGNGTARGWIYY